MHLPDIPFVVLDTETTGFLPRVNRIIEYAHIVMHGDTTIDEYETLISIPTDIPSVVQVITRIRPPSLEGKPTMDDVREEICSRMGKDTMIVGQNILFDIGMLKGEGIDLSDRPWIDTSMLASLVFPELESYSLGYISSTLNLHHEPVHRALGDVRATLELLSACWERLLELPRDLQDTLKERMRRSSPGYEMLFAALPTTKETARPMWMHMPAPTDVHARDMLTPLPLPHIAKPDIIDMPLMPEAMQHIINAAAEDRETLHVIALKNLTSALKTLAIPSGVKALQPPFLLLDDAAKKALEGKETYTADEATLLTKLEWFMPRTLSELPIHGDEKSIWSGALACTEDSTSYKEQFADLPSVVLVDHKQLLAFCNPEREDTKEARETLLAGRDRVHIIIDDASMLEDTGSKAFGWYCDINALRAAAQGDEELTTFSDLLQLWMERTRHNQDLRYIVPADLEGKEVEALREQIRRLQDSSLPAQKTTILDAIAHCLEEDAGKRITWIETRQGGNQYLHSIPESVSDLFKDYLYDTYPVTLLIPQGSSTAMQEVIPASTTVHTVTPSWNLTGGADITFPTDRKTRDVLNDPPEGKSIVLVNSKKAIENIFIDYTEILEERGITLICQNLSGGMGRMQAEFLAAEGQVVWVLTPWSFEGVELPPETVSHFFIDSLPFDHPNHAVISRRAEHYENSFMDYSLPRLKWRLFRLLRTFLRIAKKGAEIAILDARIYEKRYGGEVKEYIEGLQPSVQEESAAPRQMTLL